MLMDSDQMEPLDLDVIAVVDMLGEASLSGLSINSRKVVHFCVSRARTL